MPNRRRMAVIGTLWQPRAGMPWLNSTFSQGIPWPADLMTTLITEHHCVLFGRACNLLGFTVPVKVPFVPQFRFIYFMWECFAYMYVCVSCACPVPTEVRRGYQIPRSWNYGWL